jgi:UPF0755 protein
MPDIHVGEPGRVLGVDFGERRVGVALSDPTGRLASPLETLLRRRGRRPPLHALAELGRTHQVRAVVFGLPLELDGSESGWTAEVRRAGEEVGRRLEVPVHFVDERMTSVLAERQVRSSGLSRTRREEKGRVDAQAAAIILQRWLDSGSSEPVPAGTGAPETGSDQGAPDPDRAATPDTGSGARAAPRRSLPLLALLLLLPLLAAGMVGCHGEEAVPATTGEALAVADDALVRFTVPPGAGFRQVTDTLVARGLVGWPTLFRVYARARGDERNVRAGPYAVLPDVGWRTLLDDLVAGRVETFPVTIPEGWTLRQISGRLATITGVEAHEVLALLQDEAMEARHQVPGPGLEGYLFPDTYRFAVGVEVEEVVRAMAARYRGLWTADRRERAENLGMSEREVMTLASIVQAEARHTSEMPRIAAVFHNRLRIGYLLQADPTVQYALGERRSRLLYRDIDAVADNPYNTYTNAGLPPGPIGAAGEAALDATLWPEDSDFLYFVARPDGSHIFTRTLVEHNRARVEARREWDALARNRGGDGEE